MPTVYVGQGCRRVVLDPSMILGEGGEAFVYLLDPVTVLKLYKEPDSYPTPGEREAVRQKLERHQQKLLDFPVGLPQRVIVPQELVYDRDDSGTGRTKRRVVGYTMRRAGGGEVLFAYSQMGSPLRKAVDNNQVVGIFLDLHRSLRDIHAARVVVGDFNDLNEMVVGHREVEMFDADAWQWGPYQCTVYTDRYVDPLLIRPTTTAEREAGQGHYVFSKPHNADSDWYAYQTMLFSCLLGTGPYGGTYRPANKAMAVPHPARPLKRLTVFDPNVMFPKINAIHPRALTDELLHHFEEVFVRDRRGQFPPALLENQRWTKCPNCGTQHARMTCPECQFISPIAISMQQHVIKRGQVTATKVFLTTGTILYATMQEGKLRWVYHESGELRREDGTTVASMPTSQLAMRVRVKGNTTYLARGNKMMTISPGTRPTMLEVDAFGGNLSVIDANASYAYWVTPDGQLQREGELGGVEHIGEVFGSQTLFWVGPQFGFGFYRAGEIQMAFTFDAANRGINDQVKLPKWQGQLVDSTAVFSSERCWFLATFKERNRLVNRCFVISRNGEIEAQAEADDGDSSSWLGTIRGKSATARALYSATDDGIVAVSSQTGKIEVVREFPDTEPFVGAGANLFVAPDGLYVVKGAVIYKLVIQ